MECEECESWFHTKCVGMNDVLYQVHMNHNSYIWICCSCGLPNFSSSLFHESDVETSNPFQPLAFVDGNDPDNSESSVTNSNTAVGRPLFSSSPKKNKPKNNKPKKSNKTGRKVTDQNKTNNLLKVLNINFQSIRNKIAVPSTARDRKA